MLYGVKVCDQALGAVITLRTPIAFAVPPRIQSDGAVARSGKSIRRIGPGMACLASAVKQQYDGGSERAVLTGPEHNTIGTDKKCRFR